MRHRLREVPSGLTRYPLEVEAQQLPPETSTAELSYPIDHLRDRRRWLDCASYMIAVPNGPEGGE